MSDSKSHRSHWNRFFRTELSKESERASVILAAAMLEQALEVLLRARLVPVAVRDDPLFDGAYAPISTLSAKIDIAHRIGLISTSWARDLHLIRKIRNEFAHNVTGCSFDNATIRSRVVELVRSQGVVQAAPKVRATFPDGVAGEFQTTVSWMLWWLWTQAEKVDPMKASPDLRLENEEVAPDGRTSSVEVTPSDRAATPSAEAVADLLPESPPDASSPAV